METNLRQSNAKVFIEGLVSEKDLAVKTEDGKTKITGSLTVKTSDVNFVKFNVNVNEKTNAGTDNKCYAGLLTVMNEYKTIAEVGEAEADKVKVNGDLNLYTSAQSGANIVGFKSNFFNRVKPNEDFEQKAEFSVEVFISSIIPEINTDGDETGRVLVKGWVPTYNGIEPITLVAAEDVASAVESTFEPGQTVEFDGDIVNNRIETVTEIPMAIGKPKKKVKVEYKNELLITGASSAYEEDVTPEKPYEAEVIKAAIQERTNKLEEAKAKAQSGQTTASNARPSAQSKGRTLGF